MLAASLLTLVMAMSPSGMYPMQDTEFLKSAYCYHLSMAPRLSVDLTNNEKEEGQEKFFQKLYDNKLEFPVGKDYQDIKMQFITWVMGKFGSASDNKQIINWYLANCAIERGSSGA